MVIGDLVLGAWYETNVAWAEESRLRLDAITKTDRGWKLTMSDADEAWQFPEEIEVTSPNGFIPELIIEWEHSEKNPNRVEPEYQDRLGAALVDLGYNGIHIDAEGTLKVRGGEKELSDLAKDLEELYAIRHGS